MECPRCHKATEETKPAFWNEARVCVPCSEELKVFWQTMFEESFWTTLCSFLKLQKMPGGYEGDMPDFEEKCRVFNVLSPEERYKLSQAAYEQANRAEKARMKAMLG